MANDLYSGVGIGQLVGPPERPAPYEPIKYLLDTLPPVGSCWPHAKRKAWFTAIEALFALTYVESPEDVKAEPSGVWWMNPTPSQVVLSDRQVEQLITSLGRLDVPTDPRLPFAGSGMDKPPARQRPKAAIKTSNARKSGKAKRQRA